MASVKLSGPIEDVKVIQTPTIVIDVPSSPQAGASLNEQEISELEYQKQIYLQARKAVETIARNLQTVYDKAIVEHRQGIAKLAVEIARKILVKKVQENDYQIESIVKEALNNAPTRQDIVIRVNPKDLAACQQLQQQGDWALAGVKFVSDAAVGPAQCVIDTPRGKIESLIEEQLEQVARVLNKSV
jgi:flagellar biosynthesis/type III secretory pathway protein FliH